LMHRSRSHFCGLANTGSALNTHPYLRSSAANCLFYKNKE
jgi:hypothetical protein